MSPLPKHNHDHDCGHVHLAEGDGSARRLSFALVVIGAFAVLEVVGGVLSGSLALIADAGHMVTDAAALGLALSATWLAKRPASDRFPFGWKRAQVLAAFVNGLALVGIVGLLFVEAFQRIGSPREIDAPLMLGVAAVGLLANVVAFVLLHPNAASNVNVRGAMLHVAADIFGSVAAIISALVIMSTGWTVIDPILTVLVCFLILRSSIPLILETSNILLQAAPPEFCENEVHSALTASPSVLDVHEVRAWQLTPEDNFLSLQAVIPQNVRPEDALAGMQEILRQRFSRCDVTIQIETADVVALRREQNKSPDHAELAE